MTPPRKAPRKLSSCRPSAIVLAAGESVRFLGTKQLAEIGGKTLIGRALDAVPSAEVNETIVVLGHEAKRVAKAVGVRKGVRAVINPDYGSGMGGSIRAGIQALAKDAEGAMLLLADQAFVTRSLLRRMLTAYQLGGYSKIVAVVYGDLVTPPAIFPRRYFRELAALEGDKGARSVIERHQASLSLVRVRPRVVLGDIDTREEFEAARRLLEP